MQLNTQQQAAQRNLSYLLAEKIGQRILAGEYEAGSIPPGEIELGEQFGVSRTAVREAVKCWQRRGCYYRARVLALVLCHRRIGTTLIRNY